MRWIELLSEGGLPEPFLAEHPIQADRWRQQYFTGLVREDVAEFSRIQEIKAMRLLVELLGRVGSPLSATSIARDLQITPNAVGKYLDILEALYIIFLVRPFHSNVARAILKEPKVYFFDTGYVRGDVGVKWENACAAMLLKHVHFEQDAIGKSATLHYLRTKEGAEIDFVLCQNAESTHLIECKHANPRSAPALRWSALPRRDL